MQQPLHLRRLRFRVCPANPFARDLTGQFVQSERDRDVFFTRQLTIARDLFFQRGIRVNHRSTSYLRFADNYRRTPTQNDNKRKGERKALSFPP